MRDETKLLRKVCNEFKISKDELIGKSRIKPLPDARKVFSFIANNDLNISHTHIGRIINRDHSSVTHQITTASELLGFDQTFTNSMNRVRRQERYLEVPEKDLIKALMSQLNVKYGGIINENKTKENFNKLIETWQR